MLTPLKQSCVLFLCRHVIDIQLRVEELGCLRTNSCEINMNDILRLLHD
jgi:hypothetical protein